MKKNIIFTFIIAFSMFSSPLLTKIKFEKIQKIRTRYDRRDIKTSYEIKKMLINQGYSDISIEGYEDRKYKVRASDLTGQRIIFFVNPQTAELVK